MPLYSDTLKEQVESALEDHEDTPDHVKAATLRMVANDIGPNKED